MKNVAHTVVAHIEDQVATLGSLEIAAGSLVFNMTQTVVRLSRFHLVYGFTIDLYGPLHVGIRLNGLGAASRRNRTPGDLLLHVNVARVHPRGRVRMRRIVVPSFCLLLLDVWDDKVVPITRTVQIHINRCRFDPRVRALLFV